MRRVVLLLIVAAFAATAAPAHPLVHPAVSAPLAANGRQVLVRVPLRHLSVGVVVLHSYGHGADEGIRQGWSAAADRYGFVAVYPTRDGSWNAGLCCGTAVERNRDDVDWLTRVIRDVRSRYRLDAIYLVGFSNGGMMAERLVAERPAVASRLAVWGAAPEMPEAGVWTGVGTIWSGELDAQVPYAGGVVPIGGRDVRIRSTPSTGSWLLGARLRERVVPGAGHLPPPGWPDMAWDALRSPVPATPMMATPVFATRSHLDVTVSAVLVGSLEQVRELPRVGLGVVPVAVVQQDVGFRG